MLETKEMWEKKLKLVPPMQIAESVCADYARWEDAPRGATVVALEAGSPYLVWDAKQKRTAIMVVTKDDEKKRLRYRRGMVLGIPSSLTASPRSTHTDKMCDVM